ncbi:hypothetical protein A1O3_06818 [Capronia epimyces CBS 606.96]|uniref:Uncharacterized protein n=1 Tax=Capronia epimyces CBS 606.96 TaxID=1182542 RepID=W9Y190_9EURO|nr:uncharacterized protein A1O3_06818 [Capronia epimyces CBS 606.96]EXJ83001.1 hypothetical protein A1O3_06818 [Capronia epimyces CBS 606.96]
MSFAPFEQTQLPTPSDTPKAMEQDEPSPTSYPNHSTTWTPVDSTTPVTTNPSKKRWRDDSHLDPEVDGSYFAPARPPAPVPEEEPIYGAGMTLINPMMGMSVSAESQTGTWYEEKSQEKASEDEAVATQLRPEMPSSRKSVRLTPNSMRLPIDFSAASAPASPPKTAVDRQGFDEVTLALGIGWTKMAAEDDSIQAAARGWARYLDNHFARHIHGAQIILKSSGLNAYLVEAQEGYFLFGESLLEGKLVGRSWETCLRNLKAQPIIFEGEEVLRAERTPGPEAAQAEPAQQNILENWADYNRLNNPQLVAVANGGMDLD